MGWGYHDIYECYLKNTNHEIKPVVSKQENSEIRNINIVQDISISKILEFTKTASEFRDAFKYEFTKTISFILDLFKEVSKELKVDTSDIAYLSLEDITIMDNRNIDDQTNLVKIINTKRKNYIRPVLKP